MLRFRLRRIGESVTAFEQAVAQESRDRIAHVCLGLALVEAKRRNEASERLELALSLDPTNGNATIAPAITQVELGESGRAEAVLLRGRRPAERSGNDEQHRDQAVWQTSHPANFLNEPSPAPRSSPRLPSARR